MDIIETTTNEDGVTPKDPPSKPRILWPDGVETDNEYDEAAKGLTGAF